MRVKICGLTRQQDVDVALESGADALGFVVGSPSSPRNLPLEKAKKLMRAAPIFASKVTVTSSGDSMIVLKICKSLKPEAIQLHNHNPGLIRKLRKMEPEVKLILATALRNRDSLTEAKCTSRFSDAVLADTPSSSGMGGTGRVHNWELSARLRKEISPYPLIMAGGLTAQNVRTAILRVRPFAVDVSSGVEKRIGLKDPVKVREFITNAKGLSA